MSTQTEMFPKTTIDRAKEVLVYLEGLLQKRYDAMISANEKHEAMRELCDKQQAVIAGLEADRVMKADADFLRQAGIDPLTGEVKGDEAA